MYVVAQPVTSICGTIYKLTKETFVNQLSQLFLSEFLPVPSNVLKYAYTY